MSYIMVAKSIWASKVFNPFFFSVKWVGLKFASWTFLKRHDGRRGSLAYPAAFNQCRAWNTYKIAPCYQRETQESWHESPAGFGNHDVINLGISYFDSLQNMCMEWIDRLLVWIIFSLHGKKRKIDEKEIDEIIYDNKLRFYLSVLI